MPNLKLVMISISRGTHHRTIWTWIQPDADGKVRVDSQWLYNQFNIKRGECISVR